MKTKVTGLASLNIILGIWGGRELRLTMIDKQAKKTSGIICWNTTNKSCKPLFICFSEVVKTKKKTAFLFIPIVIVNIINIINVEK